MSKNNYSTDFLGIFFFLSCFILLYAYFCTTIFFCQCFELEINFSDKHQTKPFRVICSDQNDKTNLSIGDHDVLWEGSEFGREELSKLAREGGNLMPNITVKSTDQHKCYILSPVKENLKDREELKTTRIK